MNKPVHNFNDRDYALYKGDDICMVGTITEIQNYLGKSRNYVHNLKSPSYHKMYKDTDRYIVYEIEDD